MESLGLNERIEVRRVQSLQGERSFTLVLPKEFAVQLGIGKGDFLKCLVDGNRLIVEKMQT
jgi:antitoxin component of MazEF toxin-antitoxin module